MIKLIEFEYTDRTMRNYGVATVRKHGSNSMPPSAIAITVCGRTKNPLSDK